MKVRFLGAAGMVTGSSYLIETENEKFLIDCGLFQGSKEEERLNEENFVFDPSDLDFCLLTHAHIDHSGKIPKLVKDGFKGKIYCTNATKELCEIMLLDSAKIQESDAMWENKRRERSGLGKIEPLYTVESAEVSFSYFEGVYYNKVIKVNDNIHIRFLDAGHILGSAIIEIWVKESGKFAKLVFSGDLGMRNKPIIRDPELVAEADYVFMESTYGNRTHDEYISSINSLVTYIEDTINNGGTVIIPSFAIGRTQELIYELNNYYDNKLKKSISFPIYIDSPLAVKASEVFMNNTDVFDEFALNLIEKGDNIFEFNNLRYVKTVEESKRLNIDKTPKVIISASGMCNGGRVRHHLKHNLWNPINSVIFVGYQAKGTLGNMLQNGIDKVKLVGEEIAVKANMHSISGFSGHADKPMLLEWIGSFKSPIKNVFLVHGEDEARNELGKILSEEMNLNVHRPSLYEEFEIKTFRDTLNVETEINFDEINNNINEYFSNVFEDVSKAKNFDEEKQNEVYKNLLDIKKELLNLKLKLGK